MKYFYVKMQLTRKKILYYTATVGPKTKKGPSQKTGAPLKLGTGAPPEYSFLFPLKFFFRETEFKKKYYSKSKNNFRFRN